MKTKIAVGIWLLTMTGIWACVHAQSSAGANGQNGRYQVIAADIDFSSFGGKLPHKTAIRIDTQTGKTWELTETTDKSGARYFEWTALDDGK